MEVDYQLQNITEVINWMRSEGINPDDYTDEELQHMVEEGF